jgi:hypothetical protein
MDGYVSGGSYQEGRVIPKVPQASIAAVAQQRANSASAVIVVDGQLLQPAVESSGRSLAADGALAALAF